MSCARSAAMNAPRRTRNTKVKAQSTGGVMRRLTRRLAWLALILTVSARAEAIRILVSKDATVAAGLLADVNFGSEDTRGGLLTGSDGSGLFGPYRFFLMFLVPAFVPATSISSAVLSGFYNDDWDTFAA